MTNNNSRRTERAWRFNEFRDDSLIVNNYQSVTDTHFHNDGNFRSGDVATASVPGNQTRRYMPAINNNYMDNNKNWWERRKFVDKWAGIRLISLQSQRNLLSLYTINTHKKISYR